MVIDPSAQPDRFVPKPSQPPPVATVGVLGWARRNLFGGPVDAIVTVLLAIFLWQVVGGIWHWAVDAAIWEAESRRECLDRSPTGACWAGVLRWTDALLYGRYPRTEIWRIDIAALLLLAWILPLASRRVVARGRIALACLVLYPAVGYALFQGGERGTVLSLMVAAGLAGFALSTTHALLCAAGGTAYRRSADRVAQAVTDGKRRPKAILLGILAGLSLLFAVGLAGIELTLVKTNLWGGLSLTVMVALVTIVPAIPLGTLLALARRSSMPLLSTLAAAYIELMRALPLVPVLLLAVMMVPLFMPEGLTPNKLLLCLGALCAFEAAYMAEIVRAGMQAVPRGQLEAARSLGMNWTLEHRLIVLPRALHMMIPNIVGSFTGLLKGTTLVSIVGLYEFTEMTRALSQTTKWIGLFYEPMAVAATVYFLGCFAMTRVSRHLERTLGMQDRA